MAKKKLKFHMIRWWSRVYEKLQEDNSLQDWEKALSDEQYRDSLFKKYNL